MQSFSIRGKNRSRSDVCSVLSVRQEVARLICEYEYGTTSVAGPRCFRDDSDATTSSIYVCHRDRKQRSDHPKRSRANRRIGKMRPLQTLEDRLPTREGDGHSFPAVWLAATRNVPRFRTLRLVIRRYC